MDATILGTLIGIMTFALILLGVHIGVVLLALGLAGSWLVMGDFGVAASLMGTGPFYALFEYEIVVIPLFILMGVFVIESGISRDLYQAFFYLMGRLPGGLAIATVVSNAVFAAITGVSIASAAVFSKIALPEMSKYGYKPRFTLGTIAGSSILGFLIPPSVLLIIYGIFARESIGKLFIAAVIPGLLLSAIYIIGILLLVRLSPGLAGVKPEKAPLSTTLRSLRQTWGAIVLIILVLGGIYTGYLTPTEAGAVGALGAFILTWIKGQLSKKSMRYALHEAGLTTASFFLLFIGAQMYSRMLAVSGIVDAITGALLGLNVHPITLLLLIFIVFIILGAFIDSISIMILTLPVMLPIIEALGFNLIWFGVVSVIAVEMGLLTPPFGMVVFVMKSTIKENISIPEIFIGAFPFLVMMFITLVILVAFPVLVTWLPTVIGTGLGS